MTKQMMSVKLLFDSHKHLILMPVKVSLCLNFDKYVFREATVQSNESTINVYSLLAQTVKCFGNHICFNLPQHLQRLVNVKIHPSYTPNFIIGERYSQYGGEFNIINYCFVHFITSCS